MSDDPVLNRMLARDGRFWQYPGEDCDDPEQKRWIEMRIDVKCALAPIALGVLEREGWTLASRPDAPDDPIQRIYVRKFQSLNSGDRQAIIVDGYRASEVGEGCLWSWVNVEDSD